MRLLVIVPVKSAHEADPLFLQKLGSGCLIDTTLADAERQLERGQATLCLTTDDERVMAHVRGRNKKWLLKLRDPDEAAGNYFSTLYRALEWSRRQAGSDFDAVLILEPSHPFRPSGLIANALGMMAKDPKLDTVVSVVREYGNLWTEDAAGNLHRTTTRLGRNFYREIAGLCLLTKPATMATEDAIGHDIGFVVIEEQWAMIDIHGVEGIAMARRYHDLLAKQ
jgi:CMP-N-acetylneuraminic acid synthetase